MKEYTTTLTNYDVTGQTMTGIIKEERQNFIGSDIFYWIFSQSRHNGDICKETQKCRRRHTKSSLLLSGW
jgi:hypothetical protein